MTASVRSVSYLLCAILIGGSLPTSARAQSINQLIIDVTTGDVLVEGLSMPHSPRWHNDRLWLVEAGSGWFGFVDLGSGRFERVF